MIKAMMCLIFDINHHWSASWLFYRFTNKFTTYKVLSTYILIYCIEKLKNKFTVKFTKCTIEVANLL